MLVSSVIDASVLVDAVADRGARGDAARSAIAGASLAALDVTDAEILQALRGMWLRGELTDAGLLGAARDHASAPLARYPVRAFWPRILELRSNLSAYDAGYVALAEAIDAPLLTRDARLARAPGLRCEVVVLG